MLRQKLFGCLSLAIALLFSGGAWAADDDDEFTFDEEEVVEPEPVYTSWIELGLGWQSQDSYKFGEFNGLTNKGPFVIGNFRISRRPAWDSSDTQYWNLTGTNVGWDSRYIGFEYGQQGSFKLFASFDQTPKNLFNDGMSPYIIAAGGTNLTAPAGWVASNRKISDLTQLNASLMPVSIQHDRQKIAGGFAWQIDKHWKFTTKFYHENKEGTRTIAAIFGSSGGDPGGALIPEPVDYETDNLDIILEYAGKKTQFALSYNLSNFKDNKTSVTFQNLFDSTRWADAANFPDGFGRLALPPDNKAQTLTFSGGHLFNAKTRATFNFMYNHATQNEAFLPFTVNPNLLAPIALPRASLMGEIDTIMAQTNLNSRLSQKLTVDLGFKYENRDNNTPQDVFAVVPGDSQNQGAIDSEDARINIPYDREQMLAHVSLKYRLSSKVKLTGKYQYESLDRTYSEVAKTKEHSFSTKLQVTPGSKTSAWIGFLYGNRNGTAYIDNFLFLASHSDEFFEEEDEEFENHPLARKFFIADRERIRINGAFNWIPGETVVVGVFGNYTRDDYNQTILGLLEQKSASATFDLSYVPSEVVSYHAFVTYESLQYDQASFSWSNLGHLNSPSARMWSANTHDKIVTFGAGLDWQAIKDKLKISGDFTFSDAKTQFMLTGGTSIAFLPLPDLRSKFYMGEVKVEYTVSSELTIRGRYWYQKLDVTDWALDGVDPDTMTVIIGFGNASPHYNIHILGISTIYRF